MNIKNLLIFSSILLLSACSGSSGESRGELEAAKNAGREAARKIVTREFTDSMEFHGAILEANAEKSKFKIANQPKCEQAFDSAFYSTIRATRPDLASQLKK